MNAMIALNRVRRNRNAFNELVRIALHHLAVFERPRFRFVRVRDEIARENTFRQKTPFDASGKARAAASAQARCFDDIGHLIGRHFFHRFAKRGIAAVLFVDGDLVQIWNVEVSEN